MADFGLKRSVRLEMVELAGVDFRDENAPNVSPAILFRLKDNDLVWFEIVDFVVQQQPHFSRGPTVDNKLHTPIVDQSPVRQDVLKLKLWMWMDH